MLLRPGFAAVAVLALALGIGVNTISIAGTALLQVFVALAACALPAWRATGVDPITALHTG